MKRDIRTAMTAAAVALALACPAAVFSQVGENPSEPQQKPQTSPPANATGDGQAWQSAQNMVPGTVALTRPLDAKKDQDGSQFEAKLTHALHLKSGQELAKGTTLVGKVEQDDMQMSGRSKLAVRFTGAKMGNGETMPIRATIVQVYPPVGFTQDGSPIPDESGPNWDDDQRQNPWNPSEQHIDQIGALRNVDMHSNLASQNSGVFVSTKGDDVKLRRGSRLELALAAAGAGQQAESR
ncbi:MAG TPA: hypothetical protein VG267_17590 [Terracidiphilus sp.]|nr:hypothetical protein [Terracidiphilus sp.]